MQGLRSVFVGHPDRFFRDTKVTVELPMTQADYPAVIVRFYERNIWNAGVGHVEWKRVTDEGDTPELFQRFKHFLYTGDIELQAMALSSKDRDYLADAIVNTLAMADTEAYMDPFLARIYRADEQVHPGARSHFINLKTDEFSGFGDQEDIAPWMPEDVLVYRTSYRVPAFGEFYSREIASGPSYGKVQRVDLYPYMPPEDAEPNPNPDDPAAWITLENTQVG